ncbi:GATA transcription factor 4-like [Cornus florida]|uniref:GATA transcription factor 4-like n=1 Tax=Cornus florida TaxID=4283 RepID=UPI0028973B80|nr:GATA transcription factor 4-like [Cornus florida]
MFFSIDDHYDNYTKGVDYDTYSGLDDFEANSISSVDNDDFSECLCIPQDRLEDIEFFPNFSGDLISFNDIPLSGWNDNTSSTLPDNNLNLLQFSKKKPRTKRHRRSMKSFSGVQNLDLSKYLKKRRCSHCQSEKTPQWRMGPMGPKTLCNACGVRYKSGRLVPEYRPAASPTFDSFKHSNFHRNILKRKAID